MGPKTLKGRAISDADYTGLIEELTRIRLTSMVALETKEHLTHADLISFFEKISTAAGYAYTFAQADAAEISEVTERILAGDDGASR